LTSAGRYCWYSVFTPDTTTAAAGVSSANDNGSGRTVTGTTDSNPECFTVSPVTPSVTTTAGTGPVDFGNAITDTATLSTVAKEPGSNGGNSTYPTINATNGAFAGTITFTLYGPSNSGCGSQTSGGTGTNPYPSFNVTGYTTYGPASYTPAAPGVYHWKATYANASAVNNTLPYTDNSACDQTREDVTVRQIPTEVKTKQGWYPQDTATVTSTVGNLASGGTVDFYLFDNAGCTGTAKYAERVSVTGGSASQEVSTHNYPGATASAPSGTWQSYKVSTGYDDPADSTVGPLYWKVVYTPAGSDTSHLGSTSDCIENHTITYSNDAGPSAG
jgi:hypothetical protein